MIPFEEEWEVAGVGADYVIAAPPRAKRDALRKAGEAFTTVRICIIESSHYLPQREAFLVATHIASLHNEALERASAEAAKKKEKKK